MTRIYWYPGWRQDAFEDLTEKNARFQSEFKLGSWERYDYDLSRRTLTFSEHGVPKVVAGIEVAGTTSVEAGDWLWAWANPHLPLQCTADAKLVRAFGQENQVAELTKGHVESEDLDILGWALTAVMVRVTDALGAYRAPSKNGGAMFMTCKSIAWAS